MRGKLLLIAASIAFMAPATAIAAPTVISITAQPTAYCDTQPPGGESLQDQGYTCHKHSDTSYYYDKHIGSCSGGREKYHVVHYYTESDPTGHQDRWVSNDWNECRSTQQLDAAHVARSASVQLDPHGDWGRQLEVTHDEAATWCEQLDHPCRGLHYLGSDESGSDHRWFKWAWRSRADCPHPEKPYTVWSWLIDKHNHIDSRTPLGCTNA